MISVLIMSRDHSLMVESLGNNHRRTLLASRRFSFTTPILFQVLRFREISRSQFFSPCSYSMELFPEKFHQPAGLSTATTSLPVLALLLNFTLGLCWRLFFSPIHILGSLLHPLDRNHLAHLNLLLRIRLFSFCQIRPSVFSFCVVRLAVGMHFKPHHILL